MKVTFMEEIETHHAWREKMYCYQCDCGKYNIHHQLEPEIGNCWWIECVNCGHESIHAPTRAMAIEFWAKGDEIC